jgi:hypothetical protein
MKKLFLNYHQHFHLEVQLHVDGVDHHFLGKKSFFHEAVVELWHKISNLSQR